MSKDEPKKAPTKLETQARGQEGSLLAAPLGSLMAELSALHDSALPADIAADWVLATSLYLEVHPLMQERLHAMLGRRFERTDALRAAAARAKERSRG